MTPSNLETKALIKTNDFTFSMKNTSVAQYDFKILKAEGSLNPPTYRSSC